MVSSPVPAISSWLHGGGVRNSSRQGKPWQAPDMSAAAPDTAQTGCCLRQDPGLFPANPTELGVHKQQLRVALAGDRDSTPSFPAGPPSAPSGPSPSCFTAENPSHQVTKSSITFASDTAWHSLQHSSLSPFQCSNITAPSHHKDMGILSVVQYSLQCNCFAINFANEPAMQFKNPSQI